jgi:hypothetical protein
LIHRDNLYPILNPRCLVLEVSESETHFEILVINGGLQSQECFNTETFKILDSFSVSKVGGHVLFSDSQLTKISYPYSWYLKNRRITFGTCCREMAEALLSRDSIYSIDHHILFLMSDRHPQTVGTIISYCPYCGRSLQNRHNAETLDNLYHSHH